MIPKVSLLIAVYNAQNYIEKCLVSIFNNSLIRDCEVIIVNDGSTDNTMNIINNIIKDYSSLKIQIINHPVNKGISQTRNTALQNATGEYIIFLDSDDWVESNYLSELYNFAKQNDYDIVGCDLIHEYPEYSRNESQPLLNDKIECINDMLSCKTNGWLWIKLIKHKLILDNQLSFIDKINIMEDLIFSAKVFYYSTKIGYLQLPLYHYSHNQGSTMNKVLTIDKANQIVLVEKELRDFFNEYNIPINPSSFEYFKIHVKFKFFFKSNKEVFSKYINIWPEAYNQLHNYKTSKFRKLIISLLQKNKFIGKLLLINYRFVKNIRNKMNKNNKYTGELV